MKIGDSILADGRRWVIERIYGNERDPDKLVIVPDPQAGAIVGLWRRVNGLTFREAGKRLGCSAAHVHYMETGKRNIQDRVMKIITKPTI